MSPRVLLALAWRSLWRHRRRTVITVVSVALGLTLVIFSKSLNEGSYRQMVEDAVRMQAGHVTLEHRDYRESPGVDLSIAVPDSLRRDLEDLAGVDGTKLLISGQGVARSGRGAVGVAIMGVEPSVEADSSLFAKRIVEGGYLSDDDRQWVVIGSALAERLDVEVGKKLVLSSNDATGNLVEELFRVKGIFRIGAEEIDGYYVEAPIDALRGLYGLAPGAVTQLGVLLDDPDELDRLRADVAARVQLPEVVVLPWQQVLPDLAGMIRLDRISNGVIFWLLLALTLFTIFNTLFMSVLEREHELAVQLAIGTSPGALRLQLFLESVFVGLLGCGLGGLVGGAWAWRIQEKGLDLSGLMQEGATMSGFAMNTMIHAHVDARILLELGGTLFVLILLLGLIPMRRISRIHLADTLR